MEESRMDDGLMTTEYWISKKWLKGMLCFVLQSCLSPGPSDWRLQKPKMHSVGIEDPGPHEIPFRSDVYCEHDGLTLESQARVKIPEEVCFEYPCFYEV